MLKIVNFGKSVSIIILFIIFRVFKRFREVRPDLVPKQMKGNEAVHIRIPLEDSIEKLLELKVTLNWDLNCF